MIGTATESGLQLKESTTFSGGCAALFILTKPGIVAAVTLSGFTGMVMAGRGLPETGAGFACVASLLLMAAGSALMNSVLDRRMDRQMARLTTRSAALGRIGTGPVIAAAITLTASAIVIASALLNARVALLLVAAAIGYTPLLHTNPEAALALGCGLGRASRRIACADRTCRNNCPPRHRMPCALSNHAHLAAAPLLAALVVAP